MDILSFLYCVLHFEALLGLRNVFLVVLACPHTEIQCPDMCVAFAFRILTNSKLTIYMVVISNPATGPDTTDWL